MTPVSIRHVAPNCLSTHISALTPLINDVIKEGGAVEGRRWRVTLWLTTNVCVSVCAAFEQVRSATCVRSQKKLTF